MKRISTPLVLPAVLAVTTFVALPACETGPSDEDTSADGAEGSGETGGVDCFAIADMAACEAEPSCNWDPDLVQCVLDCSVYEDQASCMATQVCAWDSVEGCLGPFT